MSRASDSKGVQQAKREDRLESVVQRRTVEAPAKKYDSPVSRPTIDHFSVADTAPAVQLRAFDDAVTRVHQNVAAANQELYGPSGSRGMSTNVQLDAAGTPKQGATGIHEAAERGTRGGGGRMPFFDKIQSSFGGHDISSIQAHTGAQAREANSEIGSMAYATGNHVAFRGSPDLFTAAHEAAHVVQQRAGVSLRDGVGQSGDRYEQHADEVASRVVQGRSAEDLLGRFAGGASSAGVQKRPESSSAGAAAKHSGGSNRGTGRFVQLKKEDGTGETKSEAGAETKTAPPITYTVPNYVDVGAIADPVARNQAINQSYHQFDTAMTAYFGEPLVSNWCTFGQHASREAGTQIRNLQDAKRLLADMVSHLVDFTNIVTTATNVAAFISNIRRAWTVAMRAWDDIKIIIGLLREEGLVKQSVLLWLARAGITEAELHSISSRFGAIASTDILDIGFSTARDLFNVVIDTINLGIRLVTNIPSLLQAIDLIYGNMVKGNREIYESVGPAYKRFLDAGLASPDGKVTGVTYHGDSRGFLGGAFDLYSKVREQRNQMTVMADGDPARAKVASEREATAHKANLLVGYQEQLVILQPIFDTMKVELQAMAGTMNLHDPNGTHPLVGGWQDFYTRMGLDPAKTPPLDQINVNNLGELAAAEKRHGTISEYFEQNVTNKKIHNAPPSIASHAG